MRKSVSSALAAAVLGLSAMPAHAASTSGTVGIDGSVAEQCSLQQARQGPGALVNFTGIEGDTLQVVQLLDSRTLAAQSASATLSFAAVCNYPHRIRIESQNNGLWPTDGRQVTDAPGFATALPYAATVQWGGASSALQADAKVRRLVDQRIAIDAASAGDLVLSLTMAAGASNAGFNSPVLAGAYGDTLRIYLEPR